MSTTRRRFLQQSTAAGIVCATDRVWADAPADRKRLPLVVLTGSPRERGQTHGKALKEPIHALVKLWQADLVDRYQMPADAFIKKFVQRTDYLSAMKKWTPDLIDEVHGIAAGADVPFDTMFVFQLVDEYWVNGPGVAREHCSALGLGRRGDRPTYIAQNMDLEGFRDGFQAVLHVKHADTKHEALVLTNAGLIGLNGVNNRSIGVCANTLSQLANCRDGLPVACVIRGVLAQPTEAAALAFLQRIKHASGQNYVIGGPATVHDLECSAGKVSAFTPAGRTNVVWHTNHPLVNDDYNTAYREALARKKDDKAEPGDSVVRLQSLQQRLGKAGAEAGLDLVRSTLAAKDSARYPVCRPYKDRKAGFTFASTIMVLSDRPELQVTVGPPDAQPYQVHSFGR